MERYEVHKIACRTIHLYSDERSLSNNPTIQKHPSLSSDRHFPSDSAQLQQPGGSCRNEMVPIGPTTRRGCPQTEQKRRGQLLICLYVPWSLFRAKFLYL